MCVCVLKTGKMEIGKQTKQTEHGLENVRAESRERESTGGSWERAGGHWVACRADW